MQGTPDNVENVPLGNDDQPRSNETEEQGSTAGAPEAPTRACPRACAR